MAATVDRFVSSKMELFFDALDVTGDGVLDAADWVASGNRVAAVFGCTPGSAEAEALCASYQQFWAGFAAGMDSAGDGRLTKAEFTAAMEHALLSRGDELLHVISEMSGALLDICDIDGDGRITLTEYQQVFAAAFGVRPQHSAWVFEALDTDGDAVLRCAEVVRAVRQFFAGDNPRAAANHMFGPLP